MKKNFLIYFVIIFIYAVITLICLLHHEIWSDEAQVWQLCSHLSPIQLLKHLHIEGHPPLFYFCVMPFAKLSSNIIFMQLICWLASVFAVVLLFYFSPFNIYVKISILLSAGFFYFFPVIARSYSIIPVLVFLAAILYSKSKQHPFLYCILLSLIANTHVIMFGFSCMLLADFIWNNIIKKYKNEKIVKYIISSVIALVLIFYTVFQLHDTLSLNQFISLNGAGIFSNIYKVCLSFFINLYDKDIFISNIIKIWQIPFILTVFILSILLFIYLLKNSKKMFFIAFVSILFQFVVYILAYPYIFVCRIFTAYIILIFCFWIVYETNENTLPRLKLNLILFFLFSLTIYNGINYYIKDIKYNYSDAKIVSEWIKKNINPNTSVITTTNEPYTVAIAYYLENSPYHIVSLLRNSKFKYVIWDEITNINFTPLALKEYLTQHGWDNKNIFILRITNDDKKYDFSLDKSFIKVYDSKEFIIYKLNNCNNLI